MYFTKKNILSKKYLKQRRQNTHEAASTSMIIFCSQKYWGPEECGINSGKAEGGGW